MCWPRYSDKCIVELSADPINIKQKNFLHLMGSVSRMKLNQCLLSRNLFEFFGIFAFWNCFFDYNFSRSRVERGNAMFVTKSNSIVKWSTYLTGRDIVLCLVFGHRLQWINKIQLDFLFVAIKKFPTSIIQTTKCEICENIHFNGS